MQFFICKRKKEQFSAFEAFLYYATDFFVFEQSRVFVIESINIRHKLLRYKKSIFNDIPASSSSVASSSSYRRPT